MTTHSTAKTAAATMNRTSDIEWLRLFGLFGMHVGCIAVVYVGWSVTAVLVAFLLYAVRTFGLTAFYHRYFSHRAFKTSRWFQFAGGMLGCLAVQKGPLWWAAHHRKHHRESDSEDDVHSPRQGGFFWSHIGWLFSRKYSNADREILHDWKKFPELWLLDRFAVPVGLFFAFVLYVAGEMIGYLFPILATDGPMLLVWGFFVSTVFLYHVTYSVNSLAHLVGSRRYATKDDSRNNWVIALLTLGEGWHNNHHYYQSSARQGFYWWEIDVTYYLLWFFSKLGLVWDLRPVPQHVRNQEKKTG